jgi:hypothetical protein
MRRKAVFVSLLLPSLSATAAISDPQCDQASTVAVAHLRLARESRNAMNRSAFNEKCRVVFTQFVEAVAARQAVATCQDGESRQSALKVIDASDN